MTFNIAFSNTYTKVHLKTSKNKVFTEKYRNTHTALWRTL